MRLSLVLKKWLFASSMMVFLTSSSCFLRKEASLALPEANDANNCKEYLQDIPSFWSKREGYYVFVAESSAIYSDFVEHTNLCFRGLSTKDIKRYLGEPNIETSTELTYYITEACLTRDRDCNIQKIKIANGVFDETLLVSPKPFGVN
jgi:hypothetical protein